MRRPQKEGVSEPHLGAEEQLHGRIRWAWVRTEDLDCLGSQQDEGPGWAGLRERRQIMTRASHYSQEAASSWRREGAIYNGK